MTHQWDTDTCIYYLNGNSVIARKAVKCGLSNICVSGITVAELFFGAYNLQHLDANVERVNKFVQQLIVLDTITISVAELFGKNKASLKRTGQLIGDFDILIASFALAHNLTLVTNNTAHFQRLPNLRLENWTVAS